MGRQLKHVFMTYVSHHWTMAGILAWLMLILVPQLVGAVTSQKDASSLFPMIITTIGMPLVFLSIMLVPQAKAQFAHARAAITPGFVLPHAVVLTGLLLVFVVFFPLVVAWCCRFDLLGTTALSTAIAASIIWAIHLNRMWGIVVSLAVFYSTLTTAGANWWLLEAQQHRFIHAVILLASLGLLCAWIARLARLREEMDDYQNTVLWRTARKSGSEVTEQRRIVAAQLRRSKLSSWISDAWLARVGGYHCNRPPALARLLRYGFGQPAELQGLLMGSWFFLITLFLARFSFAGGGSGFGMIQFYAQMAMIFPGMFAGEWLAQRRPRIGSELLLPLSRPQFIDGLLAATAWNAAAFWLVMNIGLVILVGLTPNARTALTSISMTLLLIAAGAMGLGGLGLRISVWPSAVKRLAVMFVSMFLFQSPLIFWALGREKFGSAPFLIVVAVMAGFGVVMFRLARQAWLDAELA